MLVSIWVFALPLPVLLLLVLLLKTRRKKAELPEQLDTNSAVPTGNKQQQQQLQSTLKQSNDVWLANSVGFFR